MGGEAGGIKGFLKEIELTGKFHQRVILLIRSLKSASKKQETDIETIPMLKNNGKKIHERSSVQ